MAIRKRGFWIGVFLFIAIIILPSPTGLTESAWLVAAVALLMQGACGDQISRLIEQLKNHLKRGRCFYLHMEARLFLLR